jgi:N-acetylmuramoyl-L-alanine amidase
LNIPPRARQRLLNMRRVWALLWCCLGVAVAAAARGAVPALEPVQFLGREWYDLKAWAAAQRFTVSLNPRTRIATVSGTGTRLTFAVDSQQMVVNGVKVWLCHPVAARNDTWLVSVLDVEQVLRPLLKPVRPRPAKPVRTIVLDAGHGGKDPGHRAGALQEKRYTLLLAQQLRTKLQAAGYRVVLTRSRDTFMELPERAAAANRAKGDLFVSLHFNAAGSTDRTARGIEVFCLTPNGAASTHAPRSQVSNEVLPGHRSGARNILLAYQVQKALVAKLGLNDRGVKHARFAVLRDLAMPGILIEGGFMSVPEEMRQIADPKFRDRLAAAIVEGIRQYRRLVE